MILVTSALPQEGKTTTSINTAIVLAQKGTRVLLIDADLRRPSIHKTLGMGPKTGLSNVLTGNATLQQAVVRSPHAATLFVLTARKPAAQSRGASGLLQHEGHPGRIAGTIRPHRRGYSSHLFGHRCGGYVRRADAVVLVIRSGQTTKQALRRARDLLLQVNARVAGVLLNAVDLTLPTITTITNTRKYGNYYPRR